jgi:hypothetical protein
MPIAVFGSKVFEVTDSKLYTFFNLQYGTTLETEKQDAEGKKSSTYNKGPGLNNFGFSINLKAEFGINPRKELEDWEEITAAGVAYPFILGNKPLGGNKWLLVDAQGTNWVVDNQGNVLSLDIDLKFDEYVRPGSAEASKKSSGVASPKLSVPGLQPMDYKPSLGPEDKTAYKRSNVDMIRMANVERKLNGG